MGIKNVILVIWVFGVVCGCGDGVKTVEQSNKDYEAKKGEIIEQGRATVAAVVDSALLSGMITDEDGTDIKDSFEVAVKTGGKWVLMPDELQKAFRAKGDLQGFAIWTDARLNKMAASVLALKGKFLYNEDEFNKVAFYKHRNWKGKQGIRTGIFATVRNDGSIYLSSGYSADDWLFHEMVSVIVGDVVYDSELVPSYDSRNRRYNGGGRVFESVMYENDGGIMKAIAKASASDVVKVRLTGDKYRHDFVLSAGDKEAFRDCLALADFLGSSFVRK